ncbi:MAG: FecR domain-containing protein [Deltaproteobacteria bacterium]|nr:FecR domain-containing protein [Deltaproteobacteria bacterium]
MDLLKGGKLPARAAKVTEPVELKDVIRTKSKSRAQVLFVDDTILTLAPETRVAVADYFYDGAQGRRRALLQVFRGLAHTVVKQVLKLQEPDFIMQTQTAVIGVRGTEWYTLNLPNGTNVYNIDGLLELTSSNRLIPGSLLLPALKYSEIVRDQTLGPVKDLTPAILTMLRSMMYLGPGEPPPDITGKEVLRPDVEPFKLPEVVTPPYAPTLTPHTGKLPEVVTPPYAPPLTPHPSRTPQTYP